MNLFNRHYKAIVKRGLITPDTTDTQFLEKANEELLEWSEKFDEQEAIDLIAVLSNWLIHKGFDIKTELIKNIKHQETRKN